ncbi:hypothetical protein EH151_04300 [Elizabethkingia anophelis]|uniref:hypothetical protein n=1 Tax=Elizabethkingia anophelis TaxID=1117645 RepID=UPI0013681593|nr:hypothetical protein [Elizabethkingia anophelis]MYZ59113.1 hypothetical protein [Elizabethkingia anophelis]
MKKALKRGIKQIHTGKLLKLEISGYRYLKYTIGSKTIKVIKPIPLQKLISCNSIQNTRVRIEVFTITTKYIILLAVDYPDIQPNKKKSRPLAIEEKIKYYKKNIKQTDIIILYVIMAVIFLFSPIIIYFKVFEALPVLFLPLILVAGITLYERKKYFNTIKLMDEKVSITGIITEIIETRVHISGRNVNYSVTLYWFRVGNKLVSYNIVNKQPDIIEGDLVNITYYINKAMKNEEVVSIIKLNQF